MTKSTPGPPSHEDQEFITLKALLDVAGLSINEAAPIFGVSRTSLYTWIKGEGAQPWLHGPQQLIIRRNALAAIRLIKGVVAAGDLPLRETKQEDRPRVLAAVFKKHLSVPRPPSRADD